MRVRVNKISDERLEEVSGSWNQEFINDLVENEGKIVTLRDYKEHINGEISCKIHSDDDATWHGGGYWYMVDDEDIWNIIFTPYEEASLPEDLFRL